MYKHEENKDKSKIADTQRLHHIIQQAGNLPAANIAQQVNDKLAEDNNSLVITAPPGAGKSTLLPLTIMTATKGKILMLEPRRIAARQIAERMADILNEPVGKTVGYRVRFDTKVSEETRIEVLTEGILSRMLIEDATLEGVDAVIFDEFHERSLNSDLAFALVRQAQQIIRPDIKVIIMSATIDATSICQALHAPWLKSEGRMFPVSIEYASEDVSPETVCKAAVSATLKAHKEHDGDILVFLPGQREIEKCQEILQHFFSNDTPSPVTQAQADACSTKIYPLYGNLSLDKQRHAIAPSQEGERKIVLATPIAETSLTIEGVRIVIDSGLCRQLKYDARTEMNHLETVRISKDMATQRAGRAGRVAEGFCLRLWTKVAEHNMIEQRKPEMEEADLSSLVLDVVAFGENDVGSLPWLTPPPHSHCLQAIQLLVNLGAMDAQHAITPLGKKMASMPCHPRIARMMLSAHAISQKSLACDVAAILEEKDPLADSNEADLAKRITLLRSSRRQGSLGKWKRIARIAQEYNSMTHIQEDNADRAPQDIGNLVAHAYPERIAKAIGTQGNFRLANGTEIRMEASDFMAAYTWIALASVRPLLAAPIDLPTLDPDLTTLRDHVSWDSKQGCVVAQRERRIGKLVIDSKPIQDVPASQTVDIICDAVKKEGLSMLDWNESVQRLQRRVAQVASWHPELSIPPLDTERLMATAHDWLPFYLSQNGKIKTTIPELKKINLQEAIWNLIPYETQQQIDEIAPTHLQVPSGSRIRIDYRQGAEAPVLSVRLQECFGWADTPCVDHGRQPLLMELLSPGFKPVQLTQDLKSFWQGTYFEVRKELKRRYPKHEWPENPLECKAVRGVKKKK